MKPSSIPNVAAPREAGRDPIACRDPGRERSGGVVPAMGGQPACREPGREKFAFVNGGVETAWRDPGRECSGGVVPCPRGGGSAAVLPSCATILPGGAATLPGS